MATTADSVVIELEARNGQFNADIRRSDADFGKSMSSIERSAVKAEAAVANNARGIVGSTRQIANSQRNLGRQISDIGVGLASGQSPFLILSQQSSQVADALADGGGKAAVFARALSGPVGAAALAVGSIFATTVLPRLLATGDGLDDLVEKIKKQAEQSRLTARATEIYSNSLDGLAEAARKAREEIEKTNRSELENLQLTYGQNQQRLTKLVQERAAAEKILNEALAAQKRIIAGRGSTFISPEAEESQRAAEQIVARRVAEAQDKFNIAQRAATDAQAAAAQSRIPILDYQAAATDKVTAATHRQEAAIRALRDAYNDAAKAANGLTDPTKRQAALDTAARAYRLGAEKENKELAAALEAARASNKAAVATTRFISPVEGGRVTSGFGPRVAPTAGASTFHPGIDIAAPIDTPVRAAAGGVVISSGRLGGLGNVVIVDHGGGTITEYGHLSRLIASKGDRVSQGETIGEVGNTGISTGPHLDYRVKVNGKAVDPRKGVFATDETAVELKARSSAEREAREAERDRVKAIRDNEAFEADKAQLNAEIVAIMRAQAVTAEEIAGFQRAEVEAATTRKIIGINADEAAKKYTAEEARTLRNLALQGNALRIMAINAQEQVEISQRNARIGASIIDAEQARLDASLAFATNNRDRLAIETQILNLKYQEKKLQLEALVAQAKKTKNLEAQAEAERELALLPDQQRAEQHGIELRNQGPLAQYLREFDDPETQVEQAVVDKLKAIDQSITDAAASVLGIKDPFLKSLLQIFLQQNVLKPIYDALSQGSNGGIFGSIISGITSIVGGGGNSLGSLLGQGNGAPPPVSLAGFATGGSMQIGGRPGTDQNTLSLNGQPIARVSHGETLNVTPNARAMPSGGNTIVKQYFNLDARGGITTPQLLAQVNSTIDQKAAQAGSAAYRQSMRDAPAAVRRYQQLGTAP